MSTASILQQFRLQNLVELASLLVTTDRDLGAALLMADVMSELRNRLPPTSFAELQDHLREEKRIADAERAADRLARTHDAPETAQ